MKAGGRHMNKRLLVVAITLGLLATGVAPAHAAVKAGAKCTSAKAKIVVEGLTYTCVKNGKKLTWSKGVEPVAPTSFADLEQNAKSVPYWAWKKSSQVIAASTAKAPTLNIFIGPNSVILNDRAKPAIEMVSRLYPTAKAPASVNLVYYSFKDLAWAQAKLNELSNNESRNVTDGVDRNCRAELDCLGASARTTRDGVAILLFGVQNPLPTDSMHTSGTLEAHEYTHNLQQAPSVGTPSNWALVPRWYTEGGATFSQAASIFYATHNAYRNERDLRTQDLTKGTWLTQAWLEEFINPAGWTDWSPWDKYAGWRVYDVGCAVIEILTALKGPAATMQLIDLVAQGDKYDQAFEKIYGIKWVDAVPIISRTILKEYKS
jgi:hypothetical protein